MVAWYPIYSELCWGYLSIPLVLLLLGALLLWRKDRKALAGILISLSVAIKLITWPLIIYPALKRDWRTLLSSILTTIGVNIIALMVKGVGPFMDYYLQVSGEVLRIWHAFIYNYFLWSIGFRLFEGANIPFFRYITTPPLLSLPKVAPCALAGLAAAFLLGGMIWAMQSKDLVIAFAIIVCVIVAVSPISWEHYYVMIIISLAVMWRYLSVHKFPVWQTLIFVLILMMFFLFNEHIGDFVMILNGGQQYVEASGNMITFASSLLFWLPMVELIILTILLLRSGANQKQATIETFSARPHEI